jgi:hypothetical protein
VFEHDSKSGDSVIQTVLSIWSGFRTSQIFRTHFAISHCACPRKYVIIKGKVPHFLWVQDKVFPPPPLNLVLIYVRS